MFSHSLDPKQTFGNSAWQLPSSGKGSKLPICSMRPAVLAGFNPQWPNLIFAVVLISIENFGTVLREVPLLHFCIFARNESLISAYHSWRWIIGRVSSLEESLVILVVE